MIMVGRPGMAPLLIKDPLAARGEVGIPTSVCARPDGSLAVGFEAERIKLMRIGSYRTGFKLEVGLEKTDVLGGVSYSPDQLMGEVIRFLRERALAAVAADPAAVVLTVPVAWQEWTRDQALAACVTAGYDPALVSLETEPVAAMAGLGPLPGWTVVYDLGGGTFDCAVALDNGDGPRIYGEPFGLRHIGGRAFDDQVLRHLRDSFEQAAAIFAPADGEIDDDILRRRIQLREKCVEAKIELSFIATTQKLLSELDPAVLWSLDRAGFTTLIGALVDETVNECGRMLKTLELAPEDIGQFIQIGGSSRMPVTRTRLTHRFERPVRILEEPELAVVRGAMELALRLAAPAPAPPEPQPAAEPVPPTVAAHTPAADPAAPTGPQAAPPAEPRYRHKTFRPDQNPFDER